jgi:hypothetical protein
MPRVMTVVVPDNPTGNCWIELFARTCEAYQVHEPPLEVNQEELNRQVQAAQSACLAEHGLHLNV